ncbi:unnamed protein product, partial [Adineta steineri]
PSQILPYGVYELKLTVTLVASPNLTSSSSVYVRIISAGVTANLIQYGTAMITRGYQQDLTLDPGTFSVDPDGYEFNPSDWDYKYYCRIYGLYQFPNILGSLLPIDDPRTDPSNPSCFSNLPDNKTWIYDGFTDSPKSSITILSGSLSPNFTYQLMVQMEFHLNSSIQTMSYLLVRTDDIQSQLIVIG